MRRSIFSEAVRPPPKSTRLGGADPEQIRLSFTGAQNLFVDEQGELVLADICRRCAPAQALALSGDRWREARGEGTLCG
jgi:hypothetical protein